MKKTKHNQAMLKLLKKIKTRGLWQELSPQMSHLLFQLDIIQYRTNTIFSGKVELTPKGEEMLKELKDVFSPG